MPVNSWKNGQNTAMANCGRFSLCRMFLKGCLTCEQRSIRSTSISVHTGISKANIQHDQGPVFAWRRHMTGTQSHDSLFLHLWTWFTHKILTWLAARLASSISSYSKSTLGMPLTFSKVARPFSKWPRSMRLLGVSGQTMEPSMSRQAGTPANPRERRQPHGISFPVP